MGEVHAQMVEEWEKLFQEEQEFYGNIPEKLAAMMDIYLSVYGEPDVSTMLMTEEDLFLTIGDMTIHCKPDLVIEDRGGAVVVDHKFTAQFPSDRTEKMSDLQLLLYGFVLEETEGLTVKSVLWNCLKHSPPKSADALYRLEIPYSRTAAVGIMRDFIATAETIRTAERHGVFPHCVSRWCGTCAYRALCTMEVRGLDIEDTLRSNFVQEFRENQPEVEAE